MSVLLMVFTLIGCVFVELRPTTGGGTVRAAPALTIVEPVGGETCPALGCCGATDPAPPAAGTLLPAAACCGQFGLTVYGRDQLIGVQWTPGTGSVLDVIDDRMGPVDLSPDGVPLALCYRLTRLPQPRCTEQPENPLCDTGLPADDGLLELVFRESPSIDVWIEVNR